MSIEGIFRASQASGEMEELDSGKLIANVGLEGDRYANLKGSYSVLRVSAQNPGHQEPGRQLTILSADGVRSALERGSIKEPSSLGNFRRNITIKGISSEELLGAIGSTICIGPECVVFVHRHCVPCMYNERKNGIPGLMEAIWNEAGVSCEVLIGGTIRVGDCIKFKAKEHIGSGAFSNKIIDGGNQASGYYIPPSKRTTEMIMGARKKLRDAKLKLIDSDPEGLERLEKSYESVGLKFWPSD